MPATPSRTFLVVSAVGLYLLPLYVCLTPVGRPIYDPDLWWHLAVGAWVVENGTIPTTDPFTRLHPPWVAYSWLYEVALARLYAGFGLGGIVAFRVVSALAVTAATHALTRQLTPGRVARAVLPFAAAFITVPMLGERPWMFTLLFGTLTVSAVVRLRRGPTPWVWLLVPAYAVWANVHIQFVYGLFVLGLACLLPQAEPLSRPAYRQLWAVAVACAAATLANPYGVRIYAVVLEYATQPGPFAYVTELKARSFREAHDWLLLASFAWACFALGRRGPTAFEVVFLAAAAFFAFRSARDGWFLVLAVLLVVAPPARYGEDAPPHDPVAAAIAAGVLAALCFLLSLRHDLSESGQYRAVAGVFPVEACRVIERRSLPGPIFNDFDWGGYVVFALPRLPAALDGRTNLHGDARILRFGRVWAGLPGWRDDPDLGDAGVVLSPAASPLAELLRLDPRWKTEYEDDVAVVFVRR